MTAAARAAGAVSLCLAVALGVGVFNLGMDAKKLVELALIS